MSPSTAPAPFVAHHHKLDGDYEHLQLSWTHPNVVEVALNRARKHNALNRILWKEIGRLFSELGRTGDGCRCILLRGMGPSFSAGIDVTDQSLLPAVKQSKDPGRTALSTFSQIRDMQACFTALEECPIPVVAAIHGHCIGAGVDLICAADIRLCSTEAIFSVREVALGLAADVGTLQRLPKIVGNDSWVREVCYTGRMITADEALEVGLVNRVCAGHEDLLRAARKLCCDIAKHSPVAVVGTKQALLYARDHTLVDALEQVATYNATALQGVGVRLGLKKGSHDEKPGQRIHYPDLPAYSRL